MMSHPLDRFKKLDDAAGKAVAVPKVATLESSRREVFRKCIVCFGHPLRHLKLDPGGVLS